MPCSRGLNGRYTEPLPCKAGLTGRCRAHCVQAFTDTDRLAQTITAGPLSAYARPTPCPVLT
eukprot:2649500-Rhodomonas_salina.2